MTYCYGSSFYIFSTPEQRSNKNTIQSINLSIRQSECIVIIKENDSTQIVNFITPVTGILCEDVAIHVPVTKKYFPLLVDIDWTNNLNSNDEQEMIDQNC